MIRLNTAVSALALVGSLASNPAQAVQRVFVASFGNDANTATNCGFANPCRSFTAAMLMVDPGGEVVALDAAGYGAVTIAKSVTITANPGFYAGISASTGAAVTIATASVNVILRGLNINGIGADNGVLMTNGSQLSIENCVISNFASSGVAVETPAAVQVIDSLFRGTVGAGLYLDNGAAATIFGSKFLRNGYGVFVAGSQAAATTVAHIGNSTVSGSFVGVYVCNSNAAATGRASVFGSTIANNSYGLAVGTCTGTQQLTVGSSQVTGNPFGGFYQVVGTFETLNNNLLRQNGASTGTITVVPGG